MATQVVMDHTGDTCHSFNPDDVQALAEAEKRFNELTGMGFTPLSERVPVKFPKFVHLIRLPKRLCFFLVWSAAKLAL